MQHIDFTGLAQQLLDRARELLPSWLHDGRFRGQEFICGNLAGEKGESLSINLKSGKWADFATGEKGGDLISLYAAIHHISQADAAKALGAVPTTTTSRTPAAAPTEEQRPIGLPPADTPPPNFKTKYGEATGVWTYRTLAGTVIGYISRYDPKGARKQIMPWSWDIATSQWRNWAFTAPRPLYGLEMLGARDGAPVMFVEGEKAADAARVLAGKTYVVMAWPGGVQAISRTDFSPVAGRRVLLWPDADEPGREGMRSLASRLAPMCPEIKILDVADRPEGWDAADALAEGWDYKQLLEWAKPRAQLYQPAEVVDLAAKRKERDVAAGTDKPARTPPKSQYGIWEELSLELNSQGAPIANLSNVLRVFEGHPELKDVIYFDEFYQQYFHKDGREWTEIDELNIAAWIQRAVRFRSASSLLVHQAAVIVANRAVKNAPRNWMDTLKWDGIERIEHFFVDCFGAADNEYTRAAAKNFWISLAARVYSPGCKVDNMVVLEGGQGIFKSSALNAIGRQWFSEATESVQNKDFYLALQGKILVEIAELDAFSRAEVSKIKQVTSCRTDRFRAPYARAAQDYPRRCIFVGTTNEDTYLRDPTGGRRFWPVRCSEIRLDVINANHDQLYAEAIARFQRGETWWKMPLDATKREQEQRRQVDEWENIVEDWLIGKTEVQLRDVIYDALKIDIAKQDYNVQRRVGAVMKLLGWERVIAWNGAKSVRVWKRKGALL